MPTIKTLRRTLRAFALSAMALPLAAPAATAVAQSPRPDPSAAAVSEVRDGADLFSPEAARKAREDLTRVERDNKLATVIETVEGVGGEPIAEVLARHARRWGHEGLYLLIDKADRRIEMTETRGAAPALDPARKAAVREAFLDGFKRRQFDDGLAKGVRAIESAASTPVPAVDRIRDRLAGGMTAEAPSATATATPSKAAAPAGAGDLLVRGQVRLNLAGARRLLAAAEAKAAELGAKENLAVVDDGGHILGFVRMDGARPAGVATAITRAVHAATSRTEAAAPPGRPGTPDLLLNLSLQNASAAGGVTFTTSAGGVPLVVDGQVIGALGVGGGSGDQDAEVAASAVAHFADDLKAEAARADRDKERPAEKRDDKPVDRF